MLAAIGIVIVFLGAPGRFVNDNRFIMFWNPTKGLTQLLSIWDSQANLGTPSNLQGFLIFTYTSVIHAISGSPWITERLLHGSMLACGSVGVALLTREFIPRSRIAPALAGLWWIAAPYTAGFLLPSALYINAAMAPWLALATLRAVTSSSKWRWSAVFALGVCITGFINPPALLLTCIPLLPLVVYLLVTRQSNFSLLLGWTIRAGLLTFALMVPWIARSALSAGTLADNLGISETARAVSLSSSWSESLRGMGGWLLYWNPKGPLQLPQMGVLMDSTIVVLMTFLPIVMSYIVVVRSSRRSRLLFGSIALLCAMVMVGAFPWDSSSPFGRYLLTAYRYVPGAFAIRNVYKAGGGLLMATCVLAGFAAAQVKQRLRNRPRSMAGVVVATALVLVASSSPLWTGSQYAQPLHNYGIPSYWNDATKWLDNEPGAERALIVPAALAEIYRWGSAPSGDLFSSLMNRPYLLETLLKTGAADTSNLIFSLEDDISLSHYRRGSIGPIAHRLGIGYVVVRNDLDWEKVGSVRPADLASLRADPALSLVATFGEPGQNVTTPNDPKPAAMVENQLPPVEIYKVSGENEPVRALKAGPPLLVSGDGEAWSNLAIDGTLDRLGPIRYTGRLSTPELISALTDGATLVISDTNRLKQVRNRLTSRATLQEFTAARVEDLFGVPGSQSAVTFPDAIQIEATGRNQLVDPGAAHRPTAAFDDDPTTSWLTDAGLQLNTEGVEVSLREPKEIGSVEITTPTDPTLRQVQGFRIDFSDGTSVTSRVEKHRAAVSFIPRTVTGFRVTVTKVSGRSSAPFGITDVTVPGLSLHETTKTPDDVLRASFGKPALAKLLDDAPIIYSFSRLQGEPTPIETSLHRTFRVRNVRAFAASASITFGSQLADQQLSSILGSRMSVTAFQNPRRDLTIAAPLSADGNLDTAWEAAPLTRAGASLAFPQQLVRSVDIIFDLASGRSRPRSIEISNQGQVVGTASVQPALDCPSIGSCLRTVRIPINPVSTAALNLSMSDFATSIASGVDPTVRVVEIQLNGTSNDSASGVLPTTCRTDLAALDGIPTGFSLVGTEADLLSGKPLAANNCAPIVLGEGWHSFTSGTSGAFESLKLSTTDGRASIPAEFLPVTVTNRQNTSLSFDLHGQAGDAAITGQGFFPSWKATADGAELGAPVELDTQTAWYLPEQGAATMHTRFGPEGIYGILLKFFLFALAATVILIIANPQSRRNVPKMLHAAPHRVWFLLADVAACLFTVAIAGLPGLAMAFTALLLLHRGFIRPRLIGWAAVTCLISAAVLSVPPLGPSLLPLSPSWVTNRILPHQIALISAILLAVTMSYSLSGARPRKLSEDPSIPADAPDEDDFLDSELE
jgi:arabinofuranan 3-O-arabinosyltransferase